MGLLERLFDAVREARAGRAPSRPAAKRGAGGKPPVRNLTQTAAKDPSPGARAQAVRQLAGVNTPYVIKALEKVLLTDEALPVREAALEVLRRADMSWGLSARGGERFAAPPYPDRVFEHLVMSADYGERAERELAAAVLDRLEPEWRTGERVQSLRSNPSSVAKRRLSSSPRVRQLLRTAVKARTAEVRAQAIRELGGVDTPAVLEILEQALVSDVSLAVRGAALEALRREDMSWEVGAAGYPDRVFDRLARDLSHPYPQERELAVSVLDRLDPGWRGLERVQAALSAWFAELGAADLARREAVATALDSVSPRWTESAGAREAVSGFVLELASRDETRREAAQWALTRIDAEWTRSEPARAMLPRLDELHRANDPVVRQAARKAIERIDRLWTVPQAARRAFPDLVASGAAPALPAAQQRDALLQWLRFLRANAHVLAASPDLLFQQAANAGEASAVARAAAARLARGAPASPWLRVIGKTGRGAGLLGTLTGHSGSVYAALFTPDGSRIVSASADGSLRLWDAAEGRELCRMADITRTRVLYDLSPDGTRLVAAVGDFTVGVWGLEEGNLLARLPGHQDEVTGCAFAPAGDRIATVSLDRTLRVWDPAGRELLSVTGELPFVGCTFSPDGKHVMTWDSNAVRQWKANSGERDGPIGQHRRGIVECRYSPDGGKVLCYSRAGVSLRGARTLAEHGPLALPGRQLHRPLFSADGTRVLAVHAEGIALFDGRGTLLRELKVPAGHVGSAAFSPDDSRILAGSEDGMLRLWETDTGSELAAFRAHSAPVRSVGFSRDGTRLLSAADDGTVKQWDARAAPESGPPALAGAVTSCRFSPDGRVLVSAARSGEVRVWDARTGDVAATRAPSAKSGELAACVLAPNGRIVTVLGDAAVGWNWVRNRRVRTEFLGRAWLAPDTTRGRSRWWEQERFPGQPVVGLLARPVRALVAIRVRIMQAAGWIDRLTGALGLYQVGREVVVAGGPRPWFGRVRWQDLPRLPLAVRRKQKEGDEPTEDTVIVAERARVVHVSGGSLTVWNSAGLALFGGAARIPKRHAARSARRHARTYAIPGGERPACARPAPEGDLVALGWKTGELALWDAARERDAVPLGRTKGPLADCTFSPDGNRVLALTADGSLSLWDRRTRTELAAPNGRGLELCCYSPDGALLAGVSEDALFVWSERSSVPVFEYRLDDRPVSLAWHPDGIRLGVGSAHGLVTLLELCGVPARG